jgi:TDG/mug DNA glycosylase family protein
VGGKEKVSHPFAPLFADSSKVLILGSFPSVKSRAEGFYYGNPLNRFWKVLFSLWGEESEGKTIGEKKAFLLARRIALWDVISACSISGSADSSIGQAQPNDIPGLLKKTQIQAIFLNGKKAQALFLRFFPELKDMSAVLPSTSPADARMDLLSLEEAYRQILRYL